MRSTTAVLVAFVVVRCPPKAMAPSNPFSVIVPCHRVIGSDGGLTGYAGGLQRKAALLALEGRYPPSAINKVLSKGLPKRREAVTA